MVANGARLAGLLAAAGALGLLPSWGCLALRPPAASADAGRPAADAGRRAAGAEVRDALSPLARKLYARGFRAGLGAPLLPELDLLGGYYCHPWVLPGRGLSKEGWAVIVGAPPCALKPSLTFQEVCDLLGCKIADFHIPNRNFFSTGPDLGDAYAFECEKYTCWVWPPDPPPADLGKAVVSVAVRVQE
jgi:hypothetical protein